MEIVKKLLLKKVLFEKEIRKIEREIYDRLETILPNHSIGHWDCKKSPIDKCVYDNIKDPMNDNCIYCGSPEERK